MNIFQTIFYQPLLNALVFFYRLSGSLGVAIIALTAVIKLFLFPINRQALKAQRKAADLQPKLEKIKTDFKNEPEKLTQETIRVYKEANLNPLAGIISVFLQFPILIALYQVFNKITKTNGWDLLYPFVSAPGAIEPFFLGINLSISNTFIAVISSIFLFWQIKKTQPKVGKDKTKQGEFGQMLQKQMLYFFPFLSFFILLRVPSAVALYLIVSSSLGLLENWINSLKKPLIKEETA